jgi:hypothetical protein
VCTRAWRQFCLIDPEPRVTSAALSEGIEHCLGAVDVRRERPATPRKVAWDAPERLSDLFDLARVAHASAGEPGAAMSGKGYLGHRDGR